MNFIKEKWDFREIYLDSSSYYKILKKLYSVIKELEDEKLIDGFHFILHTSVDLRLSANWKKNKNDILRVLKDGGIEFYNCHKWKMNKRRYKGEKGLSIFYSCLEYNSRLILEIVRNFRKKAPFFIQCRHYLAAQFGFKNDHEQYINSFEATEFLKKIWQFRENGIKTK